jgi:hypothetical protein
MIDYHTFLFVDKLFKASIKDGWCFQIELECKNILELTSFSQNERDNQKRIFAGSSARHCQLCAVLVWMEHARS